MSGFRQDGGGVAKILKRQSSDHLDELFVMGGSSGGARPKIFTQIDGEEWIIKFPSHRDDPELGKQEYNYSLCAKQCGIEMTETGCFLQSNVPDILERNVLTGRILLK